MLIEIKSAEVEVQSGTSKRTGKPYTMRRQYGMVTTPKGEVRRIEVPLGDKQDPHPPGLYRVNADESLFVNGYGRLELGRLVLVREEAAPLRKAS